MVGWNHPLNKQEFDQTPGDSVGQRSLTGYSPTVAKSRTQLSDFTFTFSSRMELSVKRISKLEDNSV